MFYCFVSKIYRFWSKLNPDVLRNNFQLLSLSLSRSLFYPFQSEYFQYNLCNVLFFQTNKTHPFAPVYCKYSPAIPAQFFFCFHSNIVIKSYPTQSKRHAKCCVIQCSMSWKLEEITHDFILFNFRTLADLFLNSPDYSSSFVILFFLVLFLISDLPSFWLFINIYTQETLWRLLLYISRVEFSKIGCLNQKSHLKYNHDAFLNYNLIFLSITCVSTYNLISICSHSPPITFYSSSSFRPSILFRQKFSGMIHGSSTSQVFFFARGPSFHLESIQKKSRRRQKIRESVIMNAYIND